MGLNGLVVRETSLGWDERVIPLSPSHWPKGRGEGLELDFITNRQWFNQLCPRKEVSVKPPHSRFLRASELSVRWRGCSASPPCLACAPSSCRLFPSCVLYDKQLARSVVSNCDPIHCGSPSSSVHRILQARILQWVAISFSRELSWSRDQTWVSCIIRWILYHCTTWEAPL